MRSFAWLVAVVAACGNGGGHAGTDAPGADVVLPSDAAEADVPPADAPPPSATLIPGGGVADAPLAGTLHVYVIDAKTGAPVNGAAVTVDGKALSGTTDATGLADFKSPTLTGAQQITVVLSGYRAETWLGVNGANVTIPIDPITNAGSAGVTGTMTWGLPRPASGTMYVAAFSYTVEAPFTSAQSFVECTWSPSAATEPACGFTLNTRTGKLMVYADIYSCSTLSGGCSNPQLVGIALPSAGNRHLDLAQGDTVANIALSPITYVMRTPTYAFQQVPSSLDSAAATPYIEAGADGLVELPFGVVDPTPASATNVPAQVPVLTLPGDAAPATFTFAAEAYAAPYSISPAPSSRIVRRGVAVPSNSTTVDLGAWQDLATGLSASGMTFGFTAAAGAQLHEALITSTDGTIVYWKVLVLAPGTFTLPTVTPDPLPSGNVQLRVRALRHAMPASFNPSAFALSDFAGDEWVSVGYTQFTH